jgi:transcription elongation factor GreB
MSRAFVKEDVDPPERSGRKRSASGLPPGAINYITARGAKRLRDELERGEPAAERATELQQILASVQVIDLPDELSKGISFGATVTLKDKNGVNQTFTIVGVDELDLETDAVSWISPMGKALLNPKIGDWITLDDRRSARIEKVEYRETS